MLGIFSKMRQTIFERHNQPGFYIYPIFPMAVTFLLTFLALRLISFVFPAFGLPGLTFVGDLHIHHFVWGISVLVASGYLALIFDGPKAKYQIALFHGFGLGLAFDEFAFWLKLTDDDIARWSYDGFFIIIGVFLLIISAKRGIRMLKILWPFRK